MLREYGFGAKASSGYGVVEDKISFTINDTSKGNTNFEAFKNSINGLKNYIQCDKNIKI